MAPQGDGGSTNRRPSDLAVLGAGHSPSPDPASSPSDSVGRWRPVEETELPERLHDSVDVVCERVGLEAHRLGDTVDHTGDAAVLERHPHSHRTTREHVTLRPAGIVDDDVTVDHHRREVRSQLLVRAS